MPFTRLGRPSIHPHPSPLSRFQQVRGWEEGERGELAAIWEKGWMLPLPLQPFSYASHRKSQATLAGKHQKSIKFGNMYCRGKWETQLQKWTRGRISSVTCVLLQLGKRSEQVSDFANVSVWTLLLCPIFLLSPMFYLFGILDYFTGENFKHLANFLPCFNISSYTVECIPVLRSDSVMSMLGPTCPPVLVLVLCSD